MSRFVESLGRRVLELNSRARRGALEFMGWYALEDYLRSDRRFWRFGYDACRKYLPGSISDLSTLEIFLKSNSLPSGYGFGLEARGVEIFWVLACVTQRTGLLLDASSSLGYDFVLTEPLLSNRKITIVALSPEARCLWKKGQGM